MNYDWKACKGNLPRIKELADAGVIVICKRPNINGMGVPYYSQFFLLDGKYRRGPNVTADPETIIWDGWAYIDSTPDPKTPTDEEIRFVSLDESNHHDWNDIRYKSVWQDGFRDGAKWVISRKP